MTLLHSLSGMLEGELISAEPAAAMAYISRQGITLYRVEWINDLTIRFRFRRRDRNMLVYLCKKRGDRLNITGKRGIYWAAAAFLRRPVLTAGILLGLFLTLWLPTRVLFLSVEGNQRVPARRILEAAEESGLHFGVSRRDVRSEKLKNSLLGSLPELKWAGVNTSGCTAVISVREREPDAAERETRRVSSMVALRDGYITSCIVTRGNLLCAPGQVVQKGQVLISGFTDCGICIRAEAAEGEIYAQTIRPVSAVTPSECLIRGQLKQTHRRYSLLIGKKRINLWKDSGIWDGTCGRMYEEYYMTLPGGFRLPVALGVESITVWESTPGEKDPQWAEAFLSQCARASAEDQMNAGRILQEKTLLTAAGGCFRLEGQFLCEEMIGGVITEEIGDTNGKTD
ncbi:MAG: sporulation protein YqfD [Oscillospiraceae bacterium]|nr:sporulation protein YqfD [Oscillospiraceae bacterium]